VTVGKICAKTQTEGVSTTSTHPPTDMGIIRLPRGQFGARIQFHNNMQLVVLKINVNPCDKISSQTVVISIQSRSLE
jgi:hypothetical protein